MMIFRSISLYTCMTAVVLVWNTCSATVLITLRDVIHYSIGTINIFVYSTYHVDVSSIPLTM